jgi:HK97 family phage portal protein
MKTAKKKELRSQSLDPNIAFRDGVPQPEPFTDLTESYGAHIWVYAAAWAIASNYASLEYKGYRQTGDGGMWEEYDKHPWLPLLKRPNPYMSGYALREFTALDLELSGNAYWALERNKDSNDVQELWPIPSGKVRAVATREKMIDHYIHDVNGERIIYKYDEIIHLQYANPLSFVYGQGSLSAAKLSVMADLHAKTWNKHFFANSARPDAVFETDTVLADDVRKRVMIQWNAMHRGSDKRGKTAILEGGLKYKETNRTPKDVDFVESQKLSREEILAAFGVPPAMVGILEYANYANTKEQTAIFWKHTVMPKKRAIDAIITMRIQQLSFDLQTIFEADTSPIEALRIDEFQRSQTAVNYYNIGIPVNAIIDAFDLPFESVEGGDVPKAAGPATSVGAGTTGNSPAEPGAGKAKLPPERKALSPASSAIKDAEWKSFDQKITGREQDMAMGLRSFFRGQKARVLKSLGENAGRLVNQHVGKTIKADGKPTIDIDVIFNSINEQKRMRATSDRYISGTYYDFAVSAGKRAKPGFDFSLQDPRALDWIDGKQIKLVKEVTAYTQEQLSDAVIDSVHEAIAEGFGASETIKEITARIEDVYQFAAEGRAERIARTEIISASNAGSIEGMNQAGVEYKEWLDSRDEKVRDSHKDLGGTVVPIGEDFISIGGAHLSFPGDPDGPAEEIINCRCTILSARKDGSDE